MMSYRPSLFGVGGRVGVGTTTVYPVAAHERADGACGCVDEEDAPAPRSRRYRRRARTRAATPAPSAAPYTTWAAIMSALRGAGSESAERCSFSAGSQPR